MKIGKMSNIEYTVDLSIFFAKRIPIFVDFAVNNKIKFSFDCYSNYYCIDKITSQEFTHS